jgi:ADP-ribose pyrophosphatase YjhB (NUDIX family)
MASLGPGHYVMLVIHVGGSKSLDLKLVFQREPRSGKTWFHAGSILPNEEPVDAAVRELHEKTGLILTPDYLTLLSGEPVIVTLPQGRQLVYVYSATVPVLFAATNIRTPAQVEHASLQFGTTRVFTLLDGTIVETALEERRPECLLLSSTKVQKLLRKTRRSKGRHAEFYVIELTSTAEQQTDFHTGEELIAEQRDNFRSLLFDDFPELLQPVDSPHVSRQWDHPIDTAGPMRRQRLNRLSPAERAELNRQLN